MVVNLEFIKAIVTTEEVFLLDPVNNVVLPFADQLMEQLALKILSRIKEIHHTYEYKRHATYVVTSPR